MVSLEEAIENKSPSLQNVAPVYKRIILSIKRDKLAGYNLLQSSDWSCGYRLKA